MGDSPKVGHFQQLSPLDLSPIFTSKGVFHTKSMFFIQNWHLLLTVVPIGLIYMNDPPLVDLLQQLSPWDLSPICTSKGVFHTKSMFFIQNWHLLLNGCSYRVVMYRRPLISRTFLTIFPWDLSPISSTKGVFHTKSMFFYTKLAFTYKRLLP